MPLSRHHVRSVVRSALEEDCAYNDATTDATIGNSDIRASAHLVAKQSGIITGISVAEEAFKALDPRSEFASYLNDGQPVEMGMKNRLRIGQSCRDPECRTYRPQLATTHEWYRNSHITIRRRCPRH